MCKLAHGEEELEFFREFMKGDTRSKYSNPVQSNPMLAGLATGLANMGSVNGSRPMGAASPGGLAPMRPKPPAHTPKLNLAKLPAMMKAPGFVQTGAVPKGGPPLPVGVIHNAGMGGPPGLANQGGMQTPGLFGNSFAKTPGTPSQPATQTFNASPPGLMSSIMAANMSSAPPAQAKPPPEPKANPMLDRIAALQKQASAGVCLQFAMGNCTNANCSFSHAA